MAKKQTSIRLTDKARERIRFLMRKWELDQTKVIERSLRRAAKKEGFK